MKTHRESCWNSMVRPGMGGKMRNRGCCEAVVASMIAPSRCSAPRCSHPAPGKSQRSSGCVGSSDVWSLTQHFTHSLLMGARFAQAASVSADFPSLLQRPANKKELNMRKTEIFEEKFCVGHFGVGQKKRQQWKLVGWGKIGVSDGGMAVKLGGK